MEEETIKSWSEEELQEWLPESTFDSRTTTLCWLVSCARYDLLDLLLSTSLDVNYKKTWAFRKLCERGKYRFIEKFISLGADIHACDDEIMRTAAYRGDLRVLSRAFYYGQYQRESLEEKLCWGFLGNKEKVFELFKEYGLRINNPQSCLNVHVWSNNWFMVKRLLEDFEPLPNTFQDFAVPKDNPYVLFAFLQEGLPEERSYPLLPNNRYLQCIL